MTAEWQRFLADRAVDWGIPQQGAWSFLLHNNYHPHYSGINLLWFQPAGRSPAVVTKLCRDPQILEREFANLEQAYRCAPDVTPRPLHFGTVAGYWALWMEGLSGSRFSLEDASRPETLESACDAVISLHRGVRNPRPADADSRYDRMVLSPIETMSRFGTSAAVIEGCARLLAATPERWLAVLPVIPQHGDLYMGNLLSDGKGWRVVDWESFGAVDLPLYDLFTFFLSLLWAAGDDPSQWPEPLVRQIPRLVSRYCDQVGLGAGDAARLLPLAFANWLHLQWMDGRRDFSQRFYRLIERYFAQKQLWDNLILNGTTGSGRPV